MLTATTPSLFATGVPFLAPAQAAGNDSYTRSLLHFDAIDAQANGVASAPSALIDRAYGAPFRRNLWSTYTGTFKALFGNAAGTFGTVGVFDGSTIIQCPHAPDLIPTGDFTIEFNVAVGNTTQAAAILSKGNTGVYVPYMVKQYGSDVYFYASSSGTDWDLVNGLGLLIGIAPNTWYHVAVTRQGTTWRNYVNGSLQQTFTQSMPMMTNTSPLTIGADIGGVGWVGYIEEFRFSSMARWTSAFTSQSQPYHSRLTGGNDDATKLLLHFDQSYADSAKGAINSRTPTATAMTLSGSGSTRTSSYVSSNAAGSRVTYPASEELELGGASFTIDFMYYRSGTAGDVLSKRATNAELSAYLILDGGGNPGALSLYMSVSGVTWDVNLTITSSAAASTWHHIAVVRNGVMLLTFFNGVLATSNDIGWGAFWRSANVLSVGGNSSVSPSGSRLEEVRFSNVARWTGNFTAPVAGGAPYE